MSGVYNKESMLRPGKNASFRIYKSCMHLVWKLLSTASASSTDYSVYYLYHWF